MKKKKNYKLGENHRWLCAAAFCWQLMAGGVGWWQTGSARGWPGLWVLSLCAKAPCAGGAGGRAGAPEVTRVLHRGCPALHGAAPGHLSNLLCVI